MHIYIYMYIWQILVCYWSQRPPRTQLFGGRFFRRNLIENRSILSKLDETWSESYRVGRSGDTGRHPRARFGPEQAKKSKIQKTEKVVCRAVPYIFLYIIYMAVSRLLLFAKTAPHTTFGGRFFDRNLINNR